MIEIKEDNKRLTVQEQREANRVRREEYRKNKELERKGIQVEKSTVNISTESLEPTPKMSLKDRLAAKATKTKDETTEKKPDRKRVEKSENLISSVLPLTFSSLIALNAKKMMKEPYKDCAPTQEEINTVLLPLFSYISRQIEITGKASQDAIDLGTALLSAITVSMRMLMTYADIKNEVKAGNNEQRNSKGYREKEPERDNQGTSRNYRGDIASEIISRELDASNGADGNTDSNDGSEELRKREAQLVSNLMRRDRIGRTRMGLAP